MADISSASKCASLPYALRGGGRTVFRPFVGLVSKHCISSRQRLLHPKTSDLTTLFPSAVAEAGAPGKVGEVLWRRELRNTHPRFICNCFHEALVVLACSSCSLHSVHLDRKESC